MTHTILDWELTTERTVEQLQALVDRLPQARRYYSDGLETYRDVVYVPGVHTVSVGKQDTYTVEGCNADLRHYIAVLARKTRCVTRSASSLCDTIRLFVTTILDWELTTARTVECLQDLVDRLPQARRYYSDGLEAYQDVVYAPGTHSVSVGKRDTFSVEGCNADLRHFIAVLARKTRCVTRSEASLRDTIRLFVAAYNRRQLHHFRYPQYRRAIGEFVSP